MVYQKENFIDCSFDNLVIRFNTEFDELSRQQSLPYEEDNLKSFKKIENKA